MHLPVGSFGQRNILGSMQLSISSLQSPQWSIPSQSKYVGMQRFLFLHLNSPSTHVSLIGIGNSSLPLTQLIILFPLQERGMQRPLATQRNSLCGMQGIVLISSEPLEQSSTPSSTLYLGMQRPSMTQWNSVSWIHWLNLTFSSIPSAQSSSPSATHSRGMHLSVELSNGYLPWQVNSVVLHDDNRFVSSLLSWTSSVLQSVLLFITNQRGMHSLLLRHSNSGKTKGEACY